MSTKLKQITIAVVALLAAFMIVFCGLSLGTAHAYTGKVWKKNVTDKYLNNYNGRRMPCTAYAAKVVNKKHYGFKLKPGTVSDQNKQLNKAVKKGLAKRTVKWSNNTSSKNIKAGDVVIFKNGNLPGHIAIVGSNGGKLHHGGVGAGLVTYKYTVKEFSRFGFMRYGNFNSKYSVYRLLGKNYRKTRVKIKYTAASKKLAKEAGVKLNLSGATFKLYKGKKVVATFKTSKNGLSSLKKLPTGTYTLKQTKAPANMAIRKNMKIVIKRNKKGKICVLRINVKADKAALKAIIAENKAKAKAEAEAAEAAKAKEAEKADAQAEDTTQTSEEAA
ncbi:MAG: SpaA isopeptide-forming pilin-related protein [Eubacteriales bacterium]|nr:SpaA isopeptide-forming pilin-related protein [Eubacteriales bacterium]